MRAALLATGDGVSRRSSCVGSILVRGFSGMGNGGAEGWIGGDGAAMGFQKNLKAIRGHKAGRAPACGCAGTFNRTNLEELRCTQSHVAMR